MGFFSRFLQNEDSGVRTVKEPIIVHASAGQMFNGLDDPNLLEFIRNGGAGGVSATNALKTAAVLRCVDLLSSSLAMLPARVMNTEDKTEAVDHPVFNLIRWQPSTRHTAFEFFKLMEVNRLTHGNAFAYIVRRANGTPISLEWMDPNTVQVTDNLDWTISYAVKRRDGSVAPIPNENMLHVRDLMIDGASGAGRTKLAAEAIRISRSAEIAQGNIFENGMMAGGALTHPQVLGPEAHSRLVKAMEERYSGTQNAGKWMVLEEGMKAERFTMTGQEAQTVEARNFQIEDVARAFGVPRPLLMMDDTSWGSGIEQLAMLFVRFGLNPGIVAWEQAIRRSLLRPDEWSRYTIDIDEKELLRGTMKDQAEFFSKALGSGGHAPWMEQNEVREATGFGPHNEGAGLKQPGEQRNAPED